MGCWKRDMEEESVYSLKDGNRRRRKYKIIQILSETLITTISVREPKSSDSFQQKIS
jgi:hypothetical protein